ncbi:hypothetical protein NGM37_20660, partial [Streptomyces sp. TRM76130]|nr:hypothetical protein [Streptomyces sp. TRM76130]
MSVVPGRWRGAGIDAGFVRGRGRGVRLVRGRGAGLVPGRLRSLSLRTRLVLFTSVVLCAVSAAMGVTTILVQRAHLLSDLDQRVRDTARQAQSAARHRADGPTDLSHLGEEGQPVGAVAARLDPADDAGRVTAAEVVTG